MEVYGQSNKKHKGVSQKIEKRRNLEKKKKVDKKVKSDKGKKGKQSRTERLEKYVGKLVRAAGDDWKEVSGVFDALDGGAEVDQQ